jgi:sterol desaturase/sphingolipid hydroxylase (fatty acid hydroxylase superfamily)
MSSRYLDELYNSYAYYGRYLLDEIAHPHLFNYFWWLTGLCLFCWLWEIVLPWRKQQPVLRRDFWLDGFYVYFNYFLFPLAGFFALANIAEKALADGLALAGVQRLRIIPLQTWPGWLQILALFVVRDFVQYGIHRLLHRTAVLWEFHKVHHSVLQMGFAAHLRYHWMENVLYRTLQYLPLGILGFSVEDFFWVNVLATAIGNLNHSNIVLPLGPFKYIFNNPQMHIWHHARKLPPRSYGVNFGMSFSLWDYLFRTAYVPENGRDIPLGFKNDETYPATFTGQLVQPFKSLRR